MLETGHEVSVRLTDARNQPVTNARLTLRDSQDRRLNLPMMGGGFRGGSRSGDQEANVYPLGFLAAENYSIEARWGRSSGSNSFSVSAPGIVDLVLEGKEEK